MALIGPQTAAALGQPWSDIAASARARSRRPGRARLRLARHLERHHRRLPGGRQRQRLAVELSGLPVFDRDRNFRGYRGFGICRDVARIAELTQTRRDRLAAPQRRNRRCSATSARRLRWCRRRSMWCRSRPSAPAERVADADAGRAQARSANWRPASRRGCAAATRTSRSRPTTTRPHRQPHRAAAAGAAQPAAARRPARRAAPKDTGPSAPTPGGRPAPDPRPPAGRRAGLPARQADLRQPRLPRLDRLRAVARAGGGRRPRRAVRRAERRRARREQRRAIAHHRHQSRRPGAGRGAAVHLAVGGRIRAGADADRRRRQQRR